MNVNRTFRTCAAAASLLALAAGGYPAQARGAAVGELPQELRGSWGVETEDCNDAESEGRINVTATVIDSPGLKFTLSKIRQLPNGVWRASALRTEAGKKRKQRMDIEIVALAPDRLRFRAGNTQPEEFSFCRPSRLIG